MNVLKADMKRFGNMSVKFYAAFLIYCVLQAVVLFTGAVKFIDKGRISTVSLGDALMYFFKGAKEFHPNSDMQMDVPVFEILVVLFLVFIIAYYVINDRGALGTSIMVASQSAVYWWISKCIVCLIASAIYMAIIVVSHLLCGLVILAGKFTVNLSFTSAANIKLFVSSGDIAPETDIILVLVGCFICLFTAAMIELFLAYILNAIYGFIADIILFIAGICYMSWYSFFNYIMARRIPFVYGDEAKGIALMCVIIAAVTVAGVIYSNKKDFI